MTESLHHRSRAGASITKASVRFCCVVMCAGSRQSQWNKETGAGFAA